MNISSLDLSFDDNTIISIIGNNGAGKSSLFYAIAFVLFNYKSGDSFKDFIKTGAEESLVQLHCTFNDLPLYCEGNIKLNATVNRKTEYKGNVYTNSDHNLFLKEYDLKDLVDIMFSFQESGKEIIESNATTRADLLKKLFHFDFSNIANSCKDEQSNYKTQSIELSAIKNELDNKTYNLNPLSRTVSDKVINDWIKENNEITDSINKLSDVNNDMFIELDKKLKDTDNLIKNLKNKNDLNEQKIEGYKKQIDTFNSFISDNNIDSLNDRIVLLDNDLSNANDEYEVNKKTYKEYNDNLNILKHDLKELNGQIKIAKTGICHSCGQKIDESYLNKLLDKQKELNSNIDNYNTLIDKLDFDEDNSKAYKIEQSIKECNNIIDKVNEYNDLIKDYNDKIIETENNIKENEDLINNLMNNYHDLIKQQKSYEKLKPLLEQKEQLLEKQKDLEEKIETAKNNKIKNIEREKINEKIQKEKTENEQRLLDINNKLNDVSLNVSIMSDCINIFDNLFPSYCIIQATQKLESFMNGIIQQAFPNCSVNLKVIGKGVSLFYKKNDGKELPIKMCSGAEKSIVSLAYRLAIAKFSNIKCLILDEIDASCDDNVAQIIYKIIVNLHYFNQILFITHKSSARESIMSYNDSIKFIEVNDGHYNFIE